MYALTWFTFWLYDEVIVMSRSNYETASRVAHERHNDTHL